MTSIREFCNKHGLKEIIDEIVDNKTLDSTSSTSMLVINWKCKKGHIYKKCIYDRVIRNRGCPFCAGKQVYPGEDLKSKFPLIAAEWDYDLNEFGPEDVLPGSNKKVHWKCKHGHKWEAIINNRTSKNSGCPYCNRGSQSSLIEQLLYEAIHKTFSEATSREKHWGLEYDITFLNILIEYNGRFYHSGLNTTSNIQLEKKKREAEHNNYIFIIISETYDDIDIDIDIGSNEITYKPTSNKEMDLRKLIDALNLLLDKYKIKHISTDIYTQALKECIIKRSENESIAIRYPDLVLDWDFEKNGNIKPTDIKPGSNIKVHWKCHTCGYCWVTSAAHRVYDGTGCPACDIRNGHNGGGIAVKGLNDLKTVRPDIYNQISFDRYIEKPQEIDGLTIKSNKRIWWKCTKCGGEWQAPVSRRIDYNSGCPYCSNRKVLAGFNDLKTVNAKLAEEFDAADNELRSAEQLAYTNKEVHWKCSKCGNIWKSSINSRIKRNRSCPYCR